MRALVVRAFFMRAFRSARWSPRAALLHWLMRGTSRNLLAAVSSQSEEKLMCRYKVTIAPLGLLMRFAVPQLLRLPNSCLACAICSRGGGTIAGIRYFYLAYITYIKTILFTIRPPYLYLDI